MQHMSAIRFEDMSLKNIDNFLCAALKYITRQNDTDVVLTKKIGYY